MDGIISWHLFQGIWPYQATAMVKGMKISNVLSKALLQTLFNPSKRRSRFAQKFLLGSAEEMVNRGLVLANCSGRKQLPEEVVRQVH